MSNIWWEDSQWAGWAAAARLQTLHSVRSRYRSAESATRRKPEKKASRVVRWSGSWASVAQAAASLGQDGRLRSRRAPKRLRRTGGCRGPRPRRPRVRLQRQSHVSLQPLQRLSRMRSSWTWRTPGQKALRLGRQRRSCSGSSWSLWAKAAVVPSEPGAQAQEGAASLPGFALRQKA